MEDGHLKLFITFKLTELLHNPNILMLVKIKLAKPLEEVSKFQDKRAFQDAVDYNQVLTQSQSQSLLMLLTGVPTDQVPFLTVLLKSITLFY